MTEKVDPPIMVELHAGVRLRALRDHQHIPAGAVLVVQKAAVDVLDVWHVALAWTDRRTRRRCRVSAYAARISSISKLWDGRRNRCHPSNCRLSLEDRTSG